MENKTNSRGGCLTTFLVLIIISSVWGIFSALISSGSSNIDQLPQQYKEIIEVANSPLIRYSNLIFNCVYLAGCILMFMWKRLGVYLFVGATLVSTIFSFLTALNTFSIIFALIYTVIMLLIFYFLIRNVYKHMK